MVLKDQVAGLEVGAVDAFADFAHFPGGAGQQGADGFLEHQPDETRCSRGRCLRRSAAAVVDATSFKALRDDILGCIGVTFEERLLFFAVLRFRSLGRQAAGGDAARG